LRLIGLNPEHVPTTKFGSEFGAGTYNEEDIELVGDNFDDFKVPDFDIDRIPAATSAGGGFARFMGNRLVPRPVIVKEKCVTCGICVNMCPARPKAVDWFDGDTSKPPTYNYDRCIRCYCCQEVCPEGAIVLKAPIIRKLLVSVIG
jgi:Pyruvate/2-oxoacid:ferredoxin oxidoreductase delta subunit